MIVTDSSNGPRKAMNKLRHRQYERGVRAALGVIDRYLAVCKANRKPEDGHAEILALLGVAGSILDLIDPSRAHGIHGSEAYNEAQKEALDG